MIQVEQTQFTPPLGNCYAACIASVLECALEDVPHHSAEEGGSWDGWQMYMARLQEGFFGPRNLHTITFPYHTDWFPAGYALLGAQSPRGAHLHSVVCLDGEIVWDPHPGRASGVGEWKDWTLFYKLDPSK